jgi:hypothetical protein
MELLGRGNTTFGKINSTRWKQKEPRRIRHGSRLMLSVYEVAATLTTMRGAFRLPAPDPGRPAGETDLSLMCPASTCPASTCPASTSPASPVGLAGTARISTCQRFRQSDSVPADSTADLAGGIETVRPAGPCCLFGSFPMIITPLSTSTRSIGTANLCLVKALVHNQTPYKHPTITRPIPETAAGLYLSSLAA